MYKYIYIQIKLANSKPKLPKSFCLLWHKIDTARHVKGSQVILYQTFLKKRSNNQTSDFGLDIVSTPLYDKLKTSSILSKLFLKKLVQVEWKYIPIGPFWEALAFASFKAFSFSLSFCLKATSSWEKNK